MKAAEQYFPVVLFTMLQNMILTFEFVDQIFKSDQYSDLSCGAVAMLWPRWFLTASRHSMKIIA